MENVELIRLLKKEIAIDLTDNITSKEIQMQLASYINQLIEYDFDKLITYLYRIDVNEQKLKTLLLQHPEEDAGNLIANLIIERQYQKIKTRQQFSHQDNNINEDEKW